MPSRPRLSCAMVVLGLLLFLVAAPARAVLVAHWDFEEGTGTSAADSVGGNTGSLINMDNTNWVAGAPVPGGSNFALSFDGTNERIDVTGYKGVTGTSDRTFAAWINSTVTNTVITSWGLNSAGQKWVIRLNDSAANGTVGGLRVEVNGGYNIGATPLTDGQWHHVAVVLANDGSPDVTETQLYIDGRLEGVGGKQTRAINTASGNDMEIGRDSFIPGKNWNGLIDDVRLYDNALTASDVLALATGSFGPVPPPNAAVEWHAADDPDGGTNAVWEANKGGRPPLNLSLDPSVAFNSNPATKTPHVTAAYEFNGSGGGTFSDIENDTNGNLTDESVSIEAVFRPSDLAGLEVITEFGGTDGASFTLNGNMLQFTVTDNSSGPTIAAPIQLGEFIHAVGVIDMQGNMAHLYIDGVLVGSAAFTGVDWAGTDVCGVGTAGNLIGGNLMGYGNFAGSIGTVAIYDAPLTAAQVNAVYNLRVGPAVPEPASFALLGLATLGLIRRRRTA